MNKQLTSISLLLSLMASASAHAVGTGKILEFGGSDTGLVVFDGTTHKNAGLNCPDCHNPELFPKMKKGTVKITMADMYS
jgi:hypothetical protein